MKLTVIAAMLATLALAGCKTTQEATKAVNQSWVGQTADSFFMQFGPPESSYDMDGGGRIYRWRGGDATSYQPGGFQTQRTVAPTFAGAPPRVVTTTTYRPPVRHDYYCVAQITADAQGVIESIRISQDTDGRGLSMSRCAELFSPD